MPKKSLPREIDETAFGGQKDEEEALRQQEQARQSLSLIDQRKLTRQYIDTKVDELKKANRSNTELCERLSELIKFAKLGEVSLNIDTLTGSK